MPNCEGNKTDDRDQTDLDGLTGKSSTITWVKPPSRKERLRHVSGKNTYGGKASKCSSLSGVLTFW